MVNLNIIWYVYATYSIYCCLCWAKLSRADTLCCVADCHCRYHLYCCYFYVVVSVWKRYVIIDLGFKKPQTTFTLRIKAQILYVFWLLGNVSGEGWPRDRMGRTEASERYWTTTKVNKRLHTGRNGHGHAIFVSLHSILIQCVLLLAAATAIPKNKKNNGIYKSNNNGILQQCMHYGQPLLVEWVM